MAIPSAMDDRPRSTRVLVLLLSTVALIAVLPFSAQAPRLVDVAQMVMIGAAVAVCSRSRRSLITALALGIPAVLLRWLGVHPSAALLSRLEDAFTALLFLYVAALMLRRIFETRTVTRETIYLAVSTYLLVGVVWTFFYISLEMLQPGSFNFPVSVGRSTVWAELYYFSFVTMTTVGYGDVTPVSPMARSLAILEAVNGVMFLGVLVAGLLGRYQGGRGQGP